MCSSSLAATINIGAVAMNDVTGYFLKEDQTFNTFGKIRVGSFSISEDSIKAMIASWGSEAPTYSEYASLNSYFKDVGTGGDSGSIVTGWSFTANGTVAGTATNVSTSYIPVNSQLYVWAFNQSSYTSVDFSTNSQWALVTSTNWTVPSIGTRSLNLAVVTSQDVLLGTDLSPVSNSVKMVAAIPEPSTYMLCLFGLVLIVYRFRQIQV
jgi:hypothetical protein